MISSKPEFIPALGIVPHVIVFPHFDRMANFLVKKRFQQLLHTVPSQYTVVGIDEDTALIRIELNVEGSGQDRWRVMGRQTVKVFVGDVQKYALKSGEEVLL
jgi:cyanophycinase